MLVILLPDISTKQKFVKNIRLLEIFSVRHIPVYCIKHMPKGLCRVLYRKFENLHSIVSKTTKNCFKLYIS